jgi:phosphopantothenate-cysteine ligase
MNILITAGGTSEKIDEVRKITNTGTGKLGALTAEKLLEARPGAFIHYVCSKNAIRPNAGENVNIVIADDTAALEKAVNKICTEHKVDLIIHSMAVSDYTVEKVTTKELYESGESVVGADGKISSGLKDLVVIMKQTPKIISQLRPLAPNATIVGFKLLVDTPKETLINVAYDLLKKNDCDYVLANDMKTVEAGQHTGYLIDKEKNYTEHKTKEEIAKALSQL